MFHRSLAVVVLVLASLAAGPVSAETAPAQTIWRLLDYIAVDYPGAVHDGTIVKEGEFAEMKEFSASATKRIGELPPAPERAELQRRATTLEQLVSDKAPGEAIAAAARGLAADLIKAYPVPIAPAAPPDVEHGRALYGQLCAGCHGVTGNADGALSASLDPPAIAFTDATRASERSLFALYQVIEQGLDGTSMPSFAHLSPQDRWALAFFVGSLAYPDHDGAGKALWEADARLREGFDLKRLAGTTPATLSAELGEEKMRPLLAFLRRHPEAVAAPPARTLDLARARLDEAAAAYARGDRKGATELALSGYLDGFEPVEALLAARDRGLMTEVEGAMASLRSGIAGGESLDAVKDRVDGLKALFARVEVALARGESSGTASFLAAFTILLREGLEAVLIVMAMLAFLDKSGRRDLLPFVHGGWIGALAGGAATWGLATWVISVSGASRELTEGFGGLLAALVLLWVGVWMHGKSSADAWQRYIRANLGRVLTRRSGWLLLAIAFVVVYREVFETILFYAAIWSQGNAGSVIGGALAALATLALIAGVLMRYSRVLPIGKFFAYSSGMIAVLAVVLIGKGTAALQEAGYLPIAAWSGFPRIELLGIFPTRETLLAQVAMAALLALGFAYNKRSARVAAVRVAAQ